MPSKNFRKKFLLLSKYFRKINLNLFGYLQIRFPYHNKMKFIKTNLTLLLTFNLKNWPSLITPIRVEQVKKNHAALVFFISVEKKSV